MRVLREPNTETRECADEGVVLFGAAVDDEFVDDGAERGGDPVNHGLTANRSHHLADAAESDRAAAGEDDAYAADVEVWV